MPGDPARSGLSLVVGAALSGCVNAVLMHSRRTRSGSWSRSAVTQRRRCVQCGPPHQDDDDRAHMGDGVLAADESANRPAATPPPLDRVRAGGEVVITDRGIPVARLTALDSAGILERLTAEGVIGKATAQRPVADRCHSSTSTPAPSSNFSPPRQGVRWRPCHGTAATPHCPPAWPTQKSAPHSPQQPAITT